MLLRRLRTAVVTLAMAGALAAGPAQAKLLIRHLGPHTGGHPHSNARAIATLRHDRLAAARLNHTPGQGGRHGTPMLP